MCNLILNALDNSTSLHSLYFFAEKVIYSSPHFDPKIFLSRVHQETSAADLESGALTLKNDLKGRTQQKKQLVKENFDCFVSCKTTIDGTLQDHLTLLMNFISHLTIFLSFFVNFG